MSVLVKNVDIIDVMECNVLKGRSVLIEGDRIKLIVDRLSSLEDAAENVVVVDGCGLYLVPGLIDCHVHLCLDTGVDIISKVTTLDPVDSVLQASANALKKLKTGFTTIRDCGGVEYEIIRLRNAINTGLLDGPDILSCGQSLLITGGHFTGAVVDGPIDALKAARRLLYKGADFIKLMATSGIGKLGEDAGVSELSVNEMKAAIEVCRSNGKKSAGHAHGTQGILNAITAGVDTIEHCTMINGEIIERIIERKISIVPTFAAYSLIVEFGIESGLTSHIVEQAKRVYDEKVPRFEKAYRAGAKVAYGTDAGSPHNLFDDIFTEVKAMFDAGVSKVDILRSLTINAAEAIGLSNEVGQIKENFKANMLLLKDNPIEKLNAYESICKIIVRGKIVE